MTEFHRMTGTAFIVGVVAILCGIAIGVAISAIPHAEPGDLLSFAGSLAGAAIAVAGGVLLFKYQQWQERQSQYRLLIEAIVDAEMHGNALVLAGRRVQRTEGELRNLHNALTGAMVRLKLVEKAMPTEDLRMIKARAKLKKFPSLQALPEKVMVADMYPNSASDLTEDIQPALDNLCEAKAILEGGTSHAATRSRM